MRHTIYFLLAVVGLLASCQKKALTDNETTSGSISANDTPIPVPPYEWSSLATPGNGTTYPSDDPANHIFVAPVGNTWYCFTGDCLEAAYKLNASTKRWERQRSYGSNFCLFSDSRYFFTYQSKLYYGLSSADPGAFGSFDPVTGVRTALARFPGVDSIGVPVFFVVDGNGYMFFNGGYGAFWKYNFAANQWTNMGRSPAGKLHDPAVFVVDDKVYIGMGWESMTLNGQSFRSYKKGWKQYTIGGSSVALTSFPGDYRSRTQGFVINDNIFVGFGYYYNANNNPHTVRRIDLWRYNINSTRWTRQLDFPGYLPNNHPSAYGNLAAFTQGNAGYLVTGGINQFWRFGNTPLFLPQ